MALVSADGVEMCLWGRIAVHAVQRVDLQAGGIVVSLDELVDTGLRLALAMARAI